MSEEERWDPFRFYAPQNLYYDEADDEGIDTDELMAISPNAPAALTDVPTSSLNASRPRTVAAGYDASRRILTVVFRDGTIWNYSGVTEGEWQNFHASVSKGRPWINDQLFGVGEPADMTGLDPAVSAALYTAARNAQIKYRSVRKYKDSSGKATVYRVGKTAAAKASRANLGKNTSKGGKNPYKP
jgi:hypothetical protein